MDEAIAQFALHFLTIYGPSSGHFYRAVHRSETGEEKNIKNGSVGIKIFFYKSIATLLISNFLLSLKTL